MTSVVRIETARLILRTVTMLDAASVASRLKANYWGTGLATEAVRALLDYT